MKASRLSHMLFVVFFCSPDDFDTCGSFRGGKIKKKSALKNLVVMEHESLNTFIICISILFVDSRMPSEH